jgi:anthranilate/para-aminobenzoate synthase component II
VHNKGNAKKYKPKWFYSDADYLSAAHPSGDLPGLYPSNPSPKMRILLINNYQPGNETATYEALEAGLAGHDVRVQRYRPGLKFADDDRELVVLSGGGGEGSEIHDIYHKGKLWYEDQISYILSTGKPVLGICMGFEVIARAYGSSVVEMKDYVTGFRRSVSTKKGLQSFNKKILSQYENHKWRVPEVSSKYFEVLAESATGVEAVCHKTKPILATQFHPEKGGTLHLEKLLSLR